MRPSGALRHDQRGAGTVLTAVVLMCLGMATALALVVSGWIGSLHAARSDADLAALAGAGAHVRGLDACGAARSSAASNGGELLDCRVTGGTQSFSVRVRVQVELRPRLRAGPTHVGADAVAGSGMH